MAGSIHLDNVRLWTGDENRRWGHAVTVRDGVITAIDEPRPTDVPQLDGGGRFVSPGLIDSHIHLVQGGVFLSYLDLRSVRSRAEFEAAVAEEHERLPPGQWLIGAGWSEANWSDTSPANSRRRSSSGGERTMPDNTWLLACGDRPCVCFRMDLHAAVVNQAVLQRVGTSVDPPGGRFARSPESGQPTGLVLESALWQHILPLIPDPDGEQVRRALDLAQRYLNGLGLTSVGAMEYSREVERAFLPRRPDLTVRIAVTLLDRDWPLDTSFADQFVNDDRLKVIGFKAFVDGTLGSRTAAMLDPYSDDSGNCGVLVELAEQGRLADWCRRVTEAGYAPSMHVIGDRALRIALDALDGCVDLSAVRSARLEHAQQVAHEDLPRMRGRIASMQPLHKSDDGRTARERLGDERMAGFFAFRSLLDYGARLAFGSDWPVVSADPIEGMQAALTGRTLDGAVECPEQNLTVEEVLRAYTVNAARALQLDDCGVLEPGKHGDLAIFDRNPFETDWSRERPWIESTIFDGQVVYDRQGAATSRV